MSPVETRETRKPVPFPTRPPEPGPRLFTVEEYHQMAKAGVLDPDERVELLDGVLISMGAIGGRHSACVGVLMERSIVTLGERVTVRVQQPVRLDDRSEPEPDVVLARRQPDLYRSRPPGPEEVFLLIEVGDSTVRFDREVKAPRYASAGIAEVWLVDLDRDELRLLLEAGPEGWGEERVLRRGDRVSPQAFPELVFEVDELLGPLPAE